MKEFLILDNNSGEYVAKINTNNGKNALRLFLRNNCMSTGFYEIHKGKQWYMTSSFGAMFIAVRKW